MKMLYPLPNSISKEAVRLLHVFNQEGQYTFEFPTFDNHGEWRSLFHDFESSLTEYNKSIIKKYNPDFKEYKIRSVPVLDIKPKNWRCREKLIVYLHGGGFIFGSAQSSLAHTVPLAHATGIRVVAINYTLAPIANWRKISDELVSVVQGLLDDEFELSNMLFLGDSAGGGLATSLALKLRDEKIGIPAGLVLISPWVDVSLSGDTVHTLKSADPRLDLTTMKVAANAYAKKCDWENPYVSPLFGDYSDDFPATLIQVGTKEILLSDSIILNQVLNSGGKYSVLEVYEGMWHNFQHNYDIPESVLAWNKVKLFVCQNLNIPCDTSEK